MISKQTFKAFIQGDESATEQVYREYRNLAYFVIATYVKNQDDCNDILSDTFLKLLQNRESVKDVNGLKQFICTIAKNEAVNFIRKDSHVVQSELIDKIYGIEDKNNDVLNMLEPYLTNKEVIVVYYKVIFEMTWDEITEATGIPSSTARLFYKAAKEKLKKELKYGI